MRPVVIGMMALLTTGCAGAPVVASGTESGVTGNEKGGKLTYGAGGLSGAMNAATAHCRQFGKKAQITQMSPAPDGSGGISFDCRGTAS